MSTATTSPLIEMSHAAQLLLDNLFHSSRGVPSPHWHGEVLVARAERVAKGEAKFLDWADVKERLLRKRA